VLERGDGGGVALSEDFTTAIVLSLLLGYTLCAGTYLNVAIARDLVEAGRMRPSVFAPENAVWLHGLPASARRIGRMAGVAGFFVGLGIVWSAGVPFGAGVSRLDAAQLWASVVTPLLFVLLARAAAMTTFGARGRMDGPLRTPPGEIDLLDMHAHLVEGRVGLRLALVWIVGVTLSSLLFYDADYLLLMVAIVAAGLGVAAVALLMPARRLHRRIREAKARELAAVRRRLGPARDAAMAGEPGAAGHLADLLAYADHLTDVREWPFDNHTLSRFVLYLLIPLGSWLGGALVERLVSSVLD
jgi:hypothetical protein